MMYGLEMVNQSNFFGHILNIIIIFVDVLQKLRMMMAASLFDLNIWL